MQIGSPAEQQSSQGAQQASPLVAEQIFPVVQQVPELTQTPSQQPSTTQQSCVASQHAPPHICDWGQQNSSPMQIVPSGQHALSQHCAAVPQQSGPQAMPEGQTHIAPFQICWPGHETGRGVGVGRRAA